MTTYILNLIDLIFTLHALNHGGVELNPLMQCIPFQCFYKTVVVGLLCWWLSRHSRAGLRLCSVVYGALDLYHIYFTFGGLL